MMHYILILFLGMMLPAATLSATASENEAIAVPEWQPTDSMPNDKEALCQAALYYLNNDRLPEAKRYAERLLQLGQKENDPEYSQLYGHLILGLGSIESDHPTECYTHLETARTLAERSQNHNALMRVLNGFGNYSLFVNNDIYSAISYYFQALEEAKQINNRRLYAMILSNISGAYSLRHDPSGLMYAQEAVQIAQEINEVIPLFYGTMNTAFYYLDLGQLKQAQIAIEAVRQIHDSNGLGTESDIYLLEALLHSKKNEIKQAYASFAKAMENFPTASPSTLTMVYLKYAELLRTDHHIASAIRVLEYALYHIDNSGIRIHRPRLLKALALCYREAGQTAKALDCTFQYMEYQDTLFNETRERATQEARIKHDIYSREQQISQQKMVILNNRYKIAVLTGTLALVVLALGLIYFFYRKKAHLYKAIVRQNREYIQHEQMLVTQIEQLRQSGQPNAVSTDKLHELMNRFTSLMIEDKLFTDSSLSIASMADKLATNRTYLSKAINEMTGKTFTQLVNEYRIRQAIAEISDLQANKPLKQIAVDVGFNSISAFYSTFQSFTGMTPARYRSQLKGI